MTAVLKDGRTDGYVGGEIDGFMSELINDWTDK
jgi:hypothetical protein